MKYDIEKLVDEVILSHAKLNELNDIHIEETKNAVRNAIVLGCSAGIIQGSYEANRHLLKVRNDQMVVQIIASSLTCFGWIGIVANANFNMFATIAVGIVVNSVMWRLVYGIGDWIVDKYKNRNNKDI